MLIKNSNYNEKYSYLSESYEKKLFEETNVFPFKKIVNFDSIWLISVRKESKFDTRKKK